MRAISRPNTNAPSVADCGWITGHSYILYGPLCNGITTVMFESTPLYPDASRQAMSIFRRLIVSSFPAVNLSPFFSPVPS